MTFTLSVLFHLGFAGTAMWFDILVQWREDADIRRQYQVLMLPKPQINQRKVLWYDFRKSVPEVAADKPFGASKTPLGEKDPWGRTLIAQSPKPASNRQFIWQPKHPEPLPADIAAPNVASLPAEPAPAPKAPLKPFVPPTPERPKTSPALISEPALAVHTSVADLRDARIVSELSKQGLESAKKPSLKQFVPPSANAKTDSGAPKLIEPPTPTGQPGIKGTVPGVILGLNPTERFSAPIPEGSRSAQFARAPAAGSPSSGVSSSADAPRVPGAASHASGQPVDSAAGKPDGAVAERRTVTEILFPPMNRTMSAPLRPSSRIVPATVDARFANRDVFALVIPGPKLAGYAGDWVLWFAPRQADTGTGARIQAPVPARKEDSSNDAGFGLDSTGKGSVQFQAMIDSKGKVLSAQVLRGLNSEPFRRRAIAELRTWEFRPCLRSGEAIDVDVVLEIPFDFRPAVSQTR